METLTHTICMAREWQTGLPRRKSRPELSDDMMLTLTTASQMRLGQRTQKLLAWDGTDINSFDP